MSTRYSMCLLYPCLLFLAIVSKGGEVKPASAINLQQSVFYDTWNETQRMFDTGDYDAAVKIGGKTCEKARMLDLHPQFQEELSSMVKSLDRLTRLQANNKNIMRNVTRLRTQANGQVTQRERAELLKRAILEYKRINPNEKDFFLLLLECEQLIAECQSVVAKDPPDTLKAAENNLVLLEGRCARAFGEVSFIRTAILTAKRKLLQRKGEWDQAADSAKEEVAIYERIFPASFFHIQTLEDWGASLAHAKRYKEAKAVLERACEYVENVDHYKYSDIGVSAYLLAGETALFDGQFADAEKEFDKAQRIVDALRDGKISKNLILTLDECHIACLNKLGKQDQADALRTRSKMRF